MALRFRPKIAQELMATFMKTRTGQHVRKYVYNRLELRKFGLMIDDCIRDTPIVKEAIRRLPPDEYDDRMFRIKRALMIDVRRDHLPKEQWTKYEDDKPYLRKLITVVEAEQEEKKKWHGTYGP